tara:strand:+ start:16845 stop:18128 length:1284 start_codon:yes stop_codon:yes gene_type:complete
MLDLSILKNNFSDIKYLRESSTNLMKSLTDKQTTLKIIYTELLNNNLHETDTGLDSLHFQSKLINIEVKNYENTFKIIDNRIYGDYYKLFKTLTKYLNDNIKNKNITLQFDNKDYEVYKDLNNINDYEFERTTEIYNDIIQIIDILITELTERQHKLDMQKIKEESGLYIGTLINKIKYNNNYLKNNISLFYENTKMFNIFHKKYLTRFLLKTKLFYGQINSDIQLEESKNSLGYNLDEDHIIIMNRDEEEEIRNLINSTIDNTGKNNQYDTKNNMINELNCMISGLSDSASNSSHNKSDSGISTPNNSHLHNSPIKQLLNDENYKMKQIMELDKTIDIIIEKEESEERELCKLINNKNDYEKHKMATRMQARVRGRNVRRVTYFEVKYNTRKKDDENYFILVTKHIKRCYINAINQYVVDRSKENY